jgi:GH24 family phage-related lysozyme (muramidase)
MLLRKTGFALISYGMLFAPVVAYADEVNGAVSVGIGFPVGAVATGAVLVSMSRTKNKATKADKYTKGKLELHDRSDRYIKTDTSKVKVGK